MNSYDNDDGVDLRGWQQPSTWRRRAAQLRTFSPSRDSHKIKHEMAKPTPGTSASPWDPGIFYRDRDVFARNLAQTSNVKLCKYMKPHLCRRWHSNDMSLNNICPSSSCCLEKHHLNWHEKRRSNGKDSYFKRFKYGHVIKSIYCVYHWNV